MDVEFWLSVVEGSRKGPLAAGLRAVLALLAFAYAGGLKVFLLPYRLGIRRRARLPCPVVSVGNLTVGGTGKTPMTRLICERLRERGLRVCVLSRGYRGASEHGASVVSTPDGVVQHAGEAGDEAAMLAHMLSGVPVIAGKDRRKTGLLAWERFHPDAIVLDDGMQFYQLHRNLDIVLLDASKPFDNGWTFPRGLLREPPSHLRRAKAVVITGADRGAPERSAEVVRRARGLAPGAFVTTASFEATRVRRLDGRAPAPDIAELRVATLCALGNPAAFEGQVARLSREQVRAFRFPDHHGFAAEEVTASAREAAAEGAQALVVTEKDAIKIPQRAYPLPVLVMDAGIRVEDEAGLMAAIVRAMER